MPNLSIKQFFKGQRLPKYAYALGEFEKLDAVARLAAFRNSPDSWNRCRTQHSTYTVTGSYWWVIVEEKEPEPPEWGEYSL